MTEGAETHRLELAVDRPGVDARRVEVSAPGNATAGDVLDRLAVHLGLSGADGAVFGQSTVSGAWVDRELRIGASGLLRGEHLHVTVGLDTPQSACVLRRWTVGSPTPDANGCVPVNRPPRVLAPPYASQIRVPAPPARPEPRRFPTGALFLPLILGVVLVIITRRPEVALFALFSPMMVGWNAYEDRRTGRESFGKAGAEHDEAIEQAVADAAVAAKAWLSGVTDAFPSPTDTMARAGDLSPRIWERRPGDADFLEFRLGLSRLYAPIELTDDAAPKGVDISDAHERVEDAITLDGAPVHASLQGAGVVSIVGPPESLDDLVRWIVCQLCVQHSPRDLALAGVLSEPLAGEWITWLPHVADQLLEIPAVIIGTARSLDLIERLQKLIDERAAASGATGSAAVPVSPAVIVVLDARTGLDPAVYARLVESGQRANVATIWIGDDERLVPGNSTTVIRVGAPTAEGAVENRADGARHRFAFEGMTTEEADYVGHALAPLVDTTRQLRGAGVPARVRYDELEPDVVSPAARRRAWEDDSGAELWSLLGVSAAGPFEIDLGQGGSHVLIGGTTGSGKSELLQTMVASLAARYSPDRITFLLVDYKGGSAFKDAAELPHVVGLLTDLDEHLTRRVLLSLNAEILRREALLKAAGAGSVAELRRVNPAAAPPALIIVADEFAALAKEIPEFVDGVVDIAARGRTLGLRLVLATQRPAGIITPAILANVSLRIALRMLDEPDSDSVIDSREAAHISSALPGRALARINNNLLEFQTAFVGAPAEGVATGAVTIRDLDRRAAATQTTRDQSEGSEANAPTLLDEMVDATNKVMQLGRWSQSFAPWLPPLPAVITVADLVEDLDGAVLPSSAVLIGRTDQPERQHQGLLALDFDRHGHLLIYGTTRSGKTTILRTIAAGLIEHSPASVNIYALDFGGQGLRGLETAPQVGGVVGGEDPGRVARLFRRLGRTVDARERLLAEHGHTTYAELVANENVANLPRVVVLLDSYAALVSVIERLEGGRLLEELARLIRAGAKVGVHFVITADRRGAIPDALTTNITTKIVLRMAAPEDYTILGVDKELLEGARLTPGRGVVQGTIETQMAVMSEEVSGQGQIERFAELASRAAEQWPDERAPELGTMPVAVAREQIEFAGDGASAPLGIGDGDLRPWRFELEHNHFLVTGPSRSGRSTALSTIALGLHQLPQALRLYFLGTRRSAASLLGIWDVIVADVADQEATDAALAQCDADLRVGQSVVLVCDDTDELPDQVSTQLEVLARRGRDEPLRIVAAAENRSALRSYSGLLPELRKAKHGLLLAPDIDLDGDLLGVRLRPPIESLNVTGRGFAVRDGLVELIQVAR